MFEQFPDVMSPRDAAKALGVGRNTVYKWVKVGLLPYFMLGRNIKIPKSGLLSLVEELCYNNNYITADSPLEGSNYGGE